MENKDREVINMYDDWIRMKQRNLSFEAYFDKTKINKVAIYGMNRLGYTLLEELESCDIHVVYGIDKVLAGKAYGVPVKSLSDEWEPVDAIIVSAFQYYDEIYPIIRSKNPQIEIIPLDVLIKRILLENV